LFKVIILIVIKLKRQLYVNEDLAEGLRLDKRSEIAVKPL